MERENAPQPPRGRARARGRVTTPSSTTSSIPATSASTTPTGLTVPSVTPPPDSVTSQTSPITAAGSSTSSPEEQASLATPSAAATSQPTAQETTTDTTPEAEVALMSLTEPQSVVQQKRYTYKVTRASNLVSKLGNHEVGKEVPLLTNYFMASVAEDFKIHQYTVIFNPPYEEDQTRIRKAVLRSAIENCDGFPAYVFDGMMLFAVKELKDSQILLNTLDRHAQTPVEIRIEAHKEVDRREAVCFQIYNIFVRQCLAHCNFVQFGRKYFDPNLKAVIPQHHLEVWPGFATSLRCYERNLLLNVEMVYKVIRTKTVLDIMMELRNRSLNRGGNEEAYRKSVEKELVGRTVMTTYNNRTYWIGKVEWDMTPNKTFTGKDGSEISFLKYYKDRYGIELKSENQPLLLNQPKESELRRVGFQFKPVLLIPEKCVLCGLTDEMRANFNLMKDLNAISLAPPGPRVERLQEFMKGLISKPKIQEEMQKWQINLNPNSMVELQGIKLKEERIKAQDKTYSLAEFCKTLNLRDKLHEPDKMESWLVIVHKRDENDFRAFLNQIKQVSRSMNFRVGEPMILVVNDYQPSSYITKIQQGTSQRNGKVSMVFLILPNNRLELYAAVKTHLTVKLGIPSQCCVNKTMKKGLSVATKITVQVSCKIGGVPWIVENPMRKELVCVMGFDVYHVGAGAKGQSIGAIVATTNQDLSRTCSFVDVHKQREEVSKRMGSNVMKCLEEYFKINQDLPTRIFFYRDGVGEGQVDIVYETEMESVRVAINDLYKTKGKPEPKLAYIIVSKRIQTRFMRKVGNDKFDNPEPGTCVDDVVTMHYRYDFYIISQVARQGTVSPTSYNVIYDTSGLPPARMQQLTFKLCHNYYNWTGTISVPSVCQNAHKLAYLTGDAIKFPCKDSLQRLPFYL